MPGNIKPQRALWALPVASSARPVCLKSVATVTLVREINFWCRSHIPIALLHHAYFLDNLLQICINRNLFDSHNLSWLLMHCFEDRAIGTGKDKVYESNIIAEQWLLQAWSSSAAVQLWRSRFWNLVFLLDKKFHYRLPISGVNLPVSLTCCWR